MPKVCGGRKLSTLRRDRERYIERKKRVEG